MPQNDNVIEQKTEIVDSQKATEKTLKHRKKTDILNRKQEEKSGGKRKRALLAIDLALLALIILINLLAWNSPAFCDWYVEYIYPVLAVNVWSRFFSIFPFSMGEWLIVVALVILAAGILLAAACAVRFPVKAIVVLISEAENVSDPATATHTEKEVSAAGRKKITLPRVTCAFWNFILTVALFTVLLMTVNYFILYHTTGFAGEYLTEGDHSEEQLLDLYNMLAEKCNELSEVFERDEDGNILYDGDLEETAKAAMRSLGTTYTQLSGYYPTAKKIHFSGLFSQEYLMGIVFPYTMEANYNRIMYVTNKPFAICHELAHIKGYIREDEANFISYLACIGSGDELFQYSAYLEMYTYVINDAYKNYDIYSGIWEDAVRVNATVTADNVFLKAEIWAQVEEDAVVSTETVKEVSNTLNDANLKMNGVESGIVSYSEVVELLLDYYTENELE